MDSQEWAEQFPTVSVKIAKTILEAHGWDDVAAVSYTHLTLPTILRV